MKVRVACAALLFSLVEVCSASDATAKPAPAVPGEDVAKALAPVYQERQASRLLRSGGRDGLVASALISLSPGAAAARGVEDSEAVRHLAADYPADVLAVYVAALLCHLQKAPCTHPEYRQQLLKLDAGNAIHWLIVPSGSQLTREDLQRAAQSKLADTHFSEMLGIVRRSLQDQGAGDAAPVAWRGSTELGLMLRRNEIGRVPWPNYSLTMATCNAQAALSTEGAATTRDCAALGALLFGEQGRNIVTHSIGSTLLRRFARNTPGADAAVRFRRQYVWMSEQLPETQSSEAKERLNEEEILLGEWEAYQRNAERSGVSREPPAGWTPQRPELLLLQEERPKPTSRS
jgi:hypothetical protein